MSEIKAYKTIYRIDFPVSYELLDNLGAFSQYVGDETSKLAFSSTDLKVNLIEHSITGLMKSGGDRMKLNVTLRDIDTIIEHEEGHAIGSFHSHPSFILGDGIIRRLQESEIATFDRTGIRFWIIIEREEFRFEALRDLIAGKLSIVESAIKSRFPVTEDIGVVLESKNEEQTCIRVRMGPYRRAEKARYFTLPRDTDEGLILDIDVWQNKIQVPGFLLTKVSHQWGRLVIDVVNHLQEGILQDL